MSAILHQTRFDLLAFVRNRESVFFTLVLPVIFLLIFAAIFGSDTTTVGGREINITTYYVPNIMALAVVSAALQSLVIAVVSQREGGILKRRRSTPVAASTLIGGRALTAVVVVLANFVVLAAVGRLAFDVDLPGRTLPAVLVTLAIGAAAFGCMGFAIATLVRTEDSANPILQATILPLYFLSGVFVPDDTVPKALLSIGDVFPIRHLAQALLEAYDPASSGAGFAWGHLAVVAGWGLLGLLIAVRRFRWTPQGR